MSNKIVLFKIQDSDVDLFAGLIHEAECDSAVFVVSGVICIDFYDDHTLMYPYGNGFVEFDEPVYFGKHLVVCGMAPSKLFQAEYLEKANEIRLDLKAIADQYEADLNKDKNTRTPSNITTFRPKK